MRKLALPLLALAIGLLATGPALAELAATAIRIIIKKDTGVALSAAVPSGSAGYSLTPEDLDDHLSGFRTTKVWCELKTNGTSITGGSLKWWKYPGDGGTWGEATALSETISATQGTKWVSSPVSIAGDDGRVFCQPSSVTETGAGLDGGLQRSYNFRVEGR